MRAILIVTGVSFVVVYATFYQVGLRLTRELTPDRSAPVTRIPPDRAVPLDRVDHGQWDRLLREYVDAEGLVDYARWQQSPADRRRLKQYLETLTRGDPAATTSREGRLAFWINAYNALTIHGILEVYPTSSIRNHTPRLFGYNLWEDLPLEVGSKRHSLNAIEHKILRKLGEPRIHFAIVRASIGCPPLRAEAYTPGRLEDQLADNTRTFFSRPEHFQADVSRKRVEVSPILKWFREDFGPTPRESLTGLADYLPDEAVRQMVESGNFSVYYLDYDWGLNDQQLLSSTDGRR